MAKIKVCGISSVEDAFFCVDEGVDALGFIFYSKSPRFLLPKKAKKIVDALPCFVNKVGVFVDEKYSDVYEVAKYVGLDTLQFHGSESAAFCQRMRKDFKVIKSFFPKDETVLSNIKKYKVDGYLLDIPFQEKQKNPKSVLGYKLIKKIVKEIDCLILSGGLSSVNVESLVKNISPYAVDVARGVEEFPGKKNKKLIKKFVKAVRRGSN